MKQPLSDRMLGLVGLVLISIIIQGLWWLIKYVKTTPQRKKQEQLSEESKQVSPDGRKMCVYCKRFTDDEINKGGVFCDVCGRERGMI